VGQTGAVKGDRAPSANAIYCPDEHKPNSPFYGDLRSLMNIGRELRPRHLNLIVAALESLVPACRFHPIVY
jgi:hypothetical protein